MVAAPVASVTPSPTAAPAGVVIAIFTPATGFYSATPLLFV